MHTRRDDPEFSRVSLRDGPLISTGLGSPRRYDGPLQKSGGKLRWPWPVLAHMLILFASSRRQPECHFRVPTSRRAPTQASTALAAVRTQDLKPAEAFFVSVKRPSATSCWWLDGANAEMGHGRTAHPFLSSLLQSSDCSERMELRLLG